MFCDDRRRTDGSRRCRAGRNDSCVAELPHTNHTVVDADVESTVDQSDPGEQQIVLNRSWYRVDPEADFFIGFEPEHDPQQKERRGRGPGLRRA